MMIRINGEFLDFIGDIDVDRKAKLFEDIATTDGDVSFQFDIPDTANNKRILNFPYPDVSSKTVYQKTDCELLSDQGDVINRGYIRIERKVGRNFMCSFFGGNTLWFQMLTGIMTDVDLSQYNVDQNETTIQASWGNDSGIVFPLIDSGALSTRSYPNLLVEDFSPGIYLKDVMRKTFLSVGIKINGELLNDPLYNSIVLFSNTRNKEQIDNRSAFVSGPGSTVLVGDFEQVIFDDDSNYPYFNGSETNFDIALSRYTADITMNLKVDIAVTNITTFIKFHIYLNGVIYKVISKGTAGTGSVIIRLEAGDYIEIYAQGDPIFSGSFGSVTATFTPTYLFKAFGNTSVPLWNKIDFVAAVLSLFNTVTKYDEYTKTLTINLFDKIKEKQAVDLSNYIQVQETDYVDFISGYAKRNLLEYTEGEEIKDKREYNISTFIEYGAGEILTENEFLEESRTILESPFTAPISYKHGSIGASIERINYTELLDNGGADITNVTDDSGIARFHVASLLFFTVGTLVRIYDSTVDDYNGDWIITEVGSFLGSDYFKVLGGGHVDGATAKATSLIHGFTDSDDVFLMVNVPLKDINYFSPLNDIYLGLTPLNEMGIAFFNMLNLGEPINEDFKQGLSFGGVEDPLSYQKNLIDKFWQQFSRIINDPVKLICSANLPAVIHNQIDFLSPIYVKTQESSNLYYCNRVIGYKNSYTPCEIELIKLP